MGPPYPPLSAARLAPATQPRQHYVPRPHLWIFIAMWTILILMDIHRSPCDAAASARAGLMIMALAVVSLLVGEDA